MAPKGQKQKAKDAKAKDAKAKAAEEDAFGGSDEEAVSGFGSDNSEGEGEDDDFEEGEESEAADEPESAGEQDEEADDDGGAKKFGGSKALAKLAKDAATDLNEVKQRIHDDAQLLGNWRKSVELGEKRTRAEVFKALVGNVSLYFGYSEELAEYFLQMFSPEEAIKFFEANEQQRPLTIRTNTLKARRSSLMQSLTTRKVSVDPIGPWTKVGLKVYDSAVPVGATPEYLGGQYMIQSASSFIPVMALAPQQAETVLDMAAAPGGKTTYLGQLMKNSGTLFANDMKRDRCKSLVANCHRMGLTNVIVTNMDGRKLKDHLPKLDRVLLDAPCTGSGIVARDPSVKVNRGPKDFKEHSELQKELLTTAIDMVDAESKTGGYIVYSTCSCAVEEDEAVVDHVLKTRNVQLVSFESSVAFGVEGLTKYRELRFHPTMNLARRYYPHVHNMDGFFVAKLKKMSNEVPQRAKKDRSKGGNIQVWGSEKITKEMMETVMDFDETDGTKAPAAKKGLNKIERKKLKRQQQLAAKANAASKAKEPEEEPKPQSSGKKRKQQETVAAEEPEEQEAVVAKGKALKKKKAAATAESASPAKAKEAGSKKKAAEPAEAAEEEAPAAKPLKKKLKRKA
eukprot:TRINITY_DN1635_c0_g1_i1.p1 TRINITY_DN1635_c0_g1~~TRINITY_DN1635_c0_g1_i1.p1  ORF type:complete len:624 (-),score=243.03 TRINITY_DN1635_c0_g1_i1:93-1964(-)